MIKSILILAATYILWTASDGNIIEKTDSISMNGSDYKTDNKTYMSVNVNNLLVGTTTQYVQGVEIETNGTKIIVGGTKNTNELTDVQIINFQSQKPIELKTVENNFLLICSNFTGNVTQKLSFLDVQIKLTALKKIDKTAYEDIRDNLIWVDAYGKRFDNNWWDTCTWHPEIVGQ